MKTELKKKNKLVLCAYHWAGQKVLDHVLSRDDVADLAVFTHPAEVSRGVPDVSELARDNGVWWTFDSVNRAAPPFEPDIIASVYYRDIIGRPVIDSCGGRIFNMHPSLLPLHRGCSSTPWAIIDGDRVGGVTFHYIDTGIDTGPIILQTAIPLDPATTQMDLFNRCMSQGVRFWPAAYELVQAGFAGVPQEGEGSYHPRGVPLGGEIDPGWPEELIERYIRAMTYPPYPYATFKGREVKTMDQYRALAGQKDED